MTNPIPPGVQHVAEPLDPQPFGLYSVARPIDLPSPARLLTGVHWTPGNCGPSGVWDYDVCPEPVVPPEDFKTGDRPDDATFPRVVVWATDECSIYATDLTENIARAEHLLRLHTSLWVERHMAGLLAARATPLPAAATLAAAVGTLEQALGDAGFSGVLHARRSLAAPLAGLRLIERQGEQLATPLANAWAFGGGYTALGSTLYATGPVTIWQSEVTTRDGADYEINERQAVAERLVAVGWECPAVVYSVTVS